MPYAFSFRRQTYPDPSYLLIKSDCSRPPRRIQAMNKQIDRLVYELYDLTEEEIELKMISAC